MRLFIAIDFGPLKKDIKYIQERLENYYSKIRKTDSFHMTLLFLDERSVYEKEEIITALDNIHNEEFSLSLEKIGAFPNLINARVIWLGLSRCEEVLKLQKDIQEKLSFLNLKKEHAFLPHITLARVAHVIDKKSLERLLMSISIEKKELPVNNFYLYESRLTAEGPVYTKIKEFNLKKLQ